MKKTLLFCISIFYLLNYNAQNFQCVKTDAITHFKSENLLASIRIDSVYTGLDYSDYISYYMIRQLPNPVEYTTKGASWIGEKYRLFTNGDNQFFNKYSEEILIKKPQINASWQLFRSDNSNIVITANVDLIENETFFGITDSVATISLSAKDTNGLDIQNVTNNYILRLSKNYGLLNTLNFYNFPFIESDYDANGTYPRDSLTLAGMDNPQIGWQNITAYDIYNWEIDWEMHSERMFLASTSNPSHTHEYTQTIHKILDKSITAESVNYSIERCYYKKIYNSEIISETRIFDTINVSYALNQEINKLPYEVVYNNNEAKFFVKTDSAILFRSDWMFYYNQNYNAFLEIYSSGSSIFIWTKGVGKEYSSDEQFDGQINDFFVYYKKGTYEWGNPYFCSTLLSVSKIQKEEIKIYPNPTKEKINLEFFSDEETFITLKTISGNEVYKSKTASKNLEINLENFSTGIYLLMIETKNNTYYQKIIKE